MVDQLLPRWLQFRLSGLNAGEATDSVITKTLTLSAEAYPQLTNVAFEAGDMLVWSTKVPATSGNGGFRVNDDAMRIRFVEDGGETAVENFEDFR